MSSPIKFKSFCWPFSKSSKHDLGWVARAPLEANNQDITKSNRRAHQLLQMLMCQVLWLDMHNVSHDWLVSATGIETGQSCKVEHLNVPHVHFANNHYGFTASWQAIQIRSFGCLLISIADKISDPLRPDDPLPCESNFYFSSEFQHLVTCSIRCTCSLQHVFVRIV